jgi:hypothetical protein
MKLLLIFVPILFATFFSHAQNDYIKYFHKINDAKYTYLVDQDHKTSFDLFCNAFKHYKPVFYDYIEAAEVALLTSNKDSCMTWIKEYFNNGSSKYMVENSPVFKKYFSSNDWELIDDFHKKGKDYFFSRANLDLIEKLHYLYSADVYLGSEQVFENDSIKWVIRKQVFSNNLNNLVEIIKEDGYPGYSDIGYYSKYLKIFIIHARTDTKRDSLNIEYLKEVMLFELKKGEVSPSTYSGLFDIMVHVWEDNKIQTYGLWADTRTDKFYPIEDIWRVDERRRSIGLNSLAEKAKIRGFTIPQEYFDCGN